MINIFLRFSTNCLVSLAEMEDESAHKNISLSQCNSHTTVLGNSLTLTPNSNFSSSISTNMSWRIILSLVTLYQKENSELTEGKIGDNRKFSGIKLSKGMQRLSRESELNRTGEGVQPGQAMTVTHARARIELVQTNTPTLSSSLFAFFRRECAPLPPPSRLTGCLPALMCLPHSPLLCAYESVLRALARTTALWR